MSLGTLQKRVFLKLKDGKVHATEPVGGTYDYFEGRLRAVTTRQQDFKGETVTVVNLHFLDTDREYCLGMTATTGLCRGVLSSLCSAEQLGVIRLKPYMHGEWQRVVVENDGHRLLWKYQPNSEMDPLDFADRMVRELQYKLEQQNKAAAADAPPEWLAQQEADALPEEQEHRRGEPDGLPF